MFACTADGEIVDHRAQLTEVRPRTRPLTRPPGLPLAGTEHLNRRLIHMQHTVLKDFLVNCIDQRLQLRAARADLGTQCRSRYRQTLPRKDLFLTMQGRWSVYLATSTEASSPVVRIPLSMTCAGAGA